MPRIVGDHPRRFFSYTAWADRWYDDGVVRTRCLEWTGSKNQKGYGLFWDGRRLVCAHRWIYERWVGPIPEGYEIDHLCKNTSCQNVKHMEAVESSTNNLRSTSPTARNAAKTHCKNGHEFGAMHQRYRRIGSVNASNSEAIWASVRIALYVMIELGHASSGTVSVTSTNADQGVRPEFP
jgi:hypothetical protein